MTKTYQSESYFKLQRRFVDRHRVRRLRDAGVDYAVAGLWYAVMHDLASSAATFGEFSTDVRNFVRACGGTPAMNAEEDAQLARTWRLFERLGLVELDGDPEGVDDLELPDVFRVFVIDAEEVNEARKPTKSSTERSRRWREARRREGTNGDAGDGNPVPGDAPSVAGDACNVPGDGRNVAGDAPATGDAEPTNQPTNQPTIPDQPLLPRVATAVPASASAHAHEAAAAGDMTPRPRRRTPAAHIADAVTKLGDLAGDVETIIETAREKWPRRTMDDGRRWRDYYLPILQLTEQNDPAAVGDALERAVEVGAYSPELVSSILAEQATKPTRPAVRGVQRVDPLAAPPGLESLWDKLDQPAPSRVADPTRAAS